MKNNVWEHKTKEGATLKDTMPTEFVGCEYNDTRAYRMKDVFVVKEHCGLWDQDEYEPWPGKHKNVHSWVELENGYIVGWNENPARGWSFPVMKNPK